MLFVVPDGLYNDYDVLFPVITYHYVPILVGRGYSYMTHAVL